jgi:hypothetical protein
VTRRGKLNDVAASVLGSFISRNNDVDGYCGMGPLHALADRTQRATVCLDLIGTTGVPSDDLAARIAAAYGDTLQRQVARCGLSGSVFVAAEMRVDFDVKVSVLTSFPTTERRRVARARWWTTVGESWRVRRAASGNLDRADRDSVVYWLGRSETAGCRGRPLGE